jgi:phosphate-selective porin OprO and OprP
MANEILAARVVLIYDFGGSSDTTPATSGIENAYLACTGLRPFIFEAGHMDVPFTLDEATSSNEMMFMERSVVNIAAGDFRSAAGVRAVGDRWWGGLYITGPVSGASRMFGNGAQIGGVARGTYQLLQSDDFSLHVGVGGQKLFHPATPSGAGAPRALTLSERPELRVDPTAFLGTGASSSPGASTYGLEFAARYRSLFLQSEFFHITLDQSPTATGLDRPSLDFNGAISRPAGR